ncbi:MAG: glycosyltransferase [Bacteroidales bacterium]|nr:glycosyltransferase [Bacteroidales bacterium]
MKVFMITRGSQGDVLPYITVAKELTRRGHTVAINLPTIFEEKAKAANLKYYLQTEDDMENLMSEARSDWDMIKWIRGVTEYQCGWLPKIIKDYDILIATNTEIAAPTLAESCGIPFIRTSFAPIIPSKIIPPPVFPFPKPHPIFRPSFLWFISQKMGSLNLNKTINRCRAKFGLKKIPFFRHYTSVNGNNALVYSGVLADFDPAWNKLSCKTIGYCFSDEEAYNETDVQDLMKFVQSDTTPILFFTIGSCDYPDAENFYKLLFDACQQLNYRLIVGAGWSKYFKDENHSNNLYILKNFLPHRLIFPYCTAIISHAGCGTTHSAARFGKPQLHLPLIIDQFYWSYQCYKRGLCPDWIRSKKLSLEVIKEKVREVVENPTYQQNAEKIAAQINQENGVQTMCDYIESLVRK